MERKTYDPAAVSPPQGGYHHGLEVTGARRLLFISGQIPDDAEGKVPADFESQCRLAWRNIEAVLTEAGLGLQDLVKVTTFLTDRGQADINGRIRREVLGDHRPALTVVVAQTLESAWLLEIEAIAAA
ncbi:MAG: RidA family protein [Pseudomonadota bacterium]